MKKLLITIMALVFMLPVFSQVKSAKLQASGLTCAMCAKAVYKGLESLSFVDKIDTDLNQSAFLITFKEGTDINIDALKMKVEDAGFSVARLDITAVFEKVTLDGDTHVKIGANNYHFVSSNKVLTGEQSFRVVDKDFLPAKEHKKYSSLSTMECARTGVAGKCCTESGIAPAARIYHVII